LQHDTQLLPLLQTKNDQFRAKTPISLVEDSRASRKVREEKLTEKGAA
jgi:hypothetical protein